MTPRRPNSDTSRVPRGNDTPALTPAAAEPSRAAVIGAGLCVFTVAALAYLNSLAGPAILDDWQSIIENPSIRSLRNLGAVLTPDRGPTNGRPFYNLSLALDYAIHGTSLWGYHVVSVLVHSFAAATLFAVMWLALGLPRLRERWAGARLWLATAVALLWAVHPLLTEVVAYASQRSEAIVALLALLTLFGFLKAVSDGRRGWLIFSAAACLLAAPFKETAAMTPLLVLLLDRACVSGDYRSLWRDRRGYYGGLFFTWVAVAALLLSFPFHSRGIGTGFSVSPIAFLALEGGVLLHYLKLCIVPAPLVFDYGPYPHGVSFGTLVPGALGAAVLFLAALWLWLKRPALGFLPLAVFVLLAPTTSFVPNLYQPAAESRMYLALALVIAALVLGGWSCLGRLGPRAGAAGLMGVGAVAVLFLAMTFYRNDSYGSEAGLWADTVRKVPENPRARNSLGTSLGLKGDVAGARTQFEEAIRIDPGYLPAQFNLGVSFLNAGQADLALPHLEAAVQVPENRAEANLYLGQALLQLGRTTEAVAPLQEAATLSPGNGDAAFDLGNALGSLGRYSEAAEALGRAAALKPREPAVLSNYATALLYAGSYDLAVATYQKALALAPGNAALRANLELAVRAQAGQSNRSQP